MENCDWNVAPKWDNCTNETQRNSGNIENEGNMVDERQAQIKRVLRQTKEQFGAGYNGQGYPVDHCHSQVCDGPGYTSCANEHLFNHYDFWGRPTLVCCPHCHTIDYSHVHCHPGRSTVLWMCFMGVISACLLSWVPCFCRQCKDHQHICRHCGALLAYTRKV
ncbi:uncharacterized protein LOC142338267 isoform X2 [Convolutriloba macropyga]|uniref:uncharacterized protein LOC142338267 isoform X2 n=1 Tax=Convolutriloba macropyga TaxID=536237 RepID=UPI003F521820